MSEVLFKPAVKPESTAEHLAQRAAWDAMRAAQDEEASTFEYWQRDQQAQRASRFAEVMQRRALRPARIRVSRPTRVGRTARAVRRRTTRRQRPTAARSPDDPGEPPPPDRGQVGERVVVPAGRRAA